uniref:Uncharacterized protein n=1 Tax=Syphacia muris TaxID=451379 RepID=A0A0N5AQY2_9BILA
MAEGVEGERKQNFEAAEEDGEGCRTAAAAAAAINRMLDNNMINN